MIFGPPEITKREKRFWLRVDTSGGPGACWPWVRFIKRGYGVLCDSRGNTLAHRDAYTYLYGLLPADLMVRHRCDNPRCCNPLHHVLGTAAENAADMVRRDRHVRGERNANSKLTKEKVLSARLRYFCRDATMKQLAEENNVSAAAMYKAVSGGSWRHVGGPVYIPHQGEHDGAPRVATRELAREIWSEFHVHGVPYRVLMERYNLSSGTIGNIVYEQEAYSFLSGDAAA